MENKNIIIILIIVVVIAVVAAGMMLMQSQNVQKDSKIATSGKTFYTGDDLSIILTDLNETPIKKETVNVTVYDKHGKVVVNKSLKTNSEGMAKLKLKLDKGKYKVNVTFEGNDNFTGNSTSKKIEIKEHVEESVVEQPVQETSYAEESGSSDIVNSREYVSQDYAPGLHIKENTYANGDIEHYYEDGSHDYYDSEAHEWRYTNPDGSSGSMYVGN